MVDVLGDCFLSQYKAKGDSEWRHLHDTLCRTIAGFASRAHLRNMVEGGKVRAPRSGPATSASLATLVLTAGCRRATASCGWT